MLVEMNYAAGCFVQGIGISLSGGGGGGVY
jgi:hypothetical protein